MLAIRACMELRSTSAPTSSSALANSRARSGSGVHYRHRRRWLVQLFLADGVQLQCAWASRENLQRTPPDITICLEKWCSRVTSRSATGLWPQSAMRRSLLKPQTHRAAYIKLRSACASVAGSSQKILRCAGQKILCSIQQQNPKRNL